MKNTIQRELIISLPIERVWEAIADRAALEEWMYPNDFEPLVGHHFTFRVPPKPSVGFEGLLVKCEVLVCEPPSLLEFSWSAGGPVVNTRVSFKLEPDDGQTRLIFEHSGFDTTAEWGEHAFKGAQFGWAEMLSQLSDLLEGLKHPEKL